MNPSGMESVTKACEDPRMALSSFLIYSSRDVDETQESLFQVQMVPSTSELDSLPGNDTNSQGNSKALPEISADDSSSRKPKFKVYSVRKSTIRLHSCVECGKSFPNPYAMKSHALRHHNLKRTHPCLECGDRFPTTSELMGHLRSHSRSKRYRCPECDEGFSEYGHLTQHMKIHIGDEFYHCPTCGQQFSYECNLKRHQLVHHQEVVYANVVDLDDANAAQGLLEDDQTNSEGAEESIDCPNEETDSADLARCTEPGAS